MQELLRLIPKVDSLLTHKALQSFSKATLVPIINAELAKLRSDILQGRVAESTLKDSIEALIARIKAKATKSTKPTMQSVINATGVVLQTNLGRSVFAKDLIDEISPLLTSYNTLEFDLDSGKRGERYVHSTQILREMFEVESALLVNNNAAAVLLILNTFAKRKEVVISRGELVEIGGSFRIPEVMKSANAILREVGATNKTHLDDYKSAINDKTAILMKAHQSNFRQIGFTHAISPKELINLARAHNLIDYIDVGSGHIGALALRDEPNVLELCKLKPSLLSFSGDKLLGGPQVGIILGKAHLIDKLKKNHLLRALRVDKFSILALNATLKAYMEKAYHKIPSLDMLTKPLKALESSAMKLKKDIEALCVAKQLEVHITPLQSLAGGGSAPHLSFKSFGLKIVAKGISAKDFEARLRQRGLIVCVKDNAILLDMRTLLANDDTKILAILESVLV